jgi:hypothetical protein
MSLNAPIKSPPKYLYKYTTVEAAIQVLKTRKLRWGSPDYFNRLNDVFDTPKSLYFGFTETELLQEYMATLIRHVEAGAVDLPDGHQQSRRFLSYAREAAAHSGRSFSEIAKFMRREFTADKLTVAEPLLGVFQRVWDELRPTLRILCMSAVADSSPMWTHYAGQHQGVVLQFEPTIEFDSALLLMRKVVYSDDQPTIFTKEQGARDVVGVERVNLREFFSEYQYRKTRGWSYEEEWRIVNYARDVDEGDFTDYEFLPIDLRRIIFGHRCTIDSEQSLRELCSEFCSGVRWKRVRFTRAHLDNRSRRIVVQPIP